MTWELKWASLFHCQGQPGWCFYGDYRCGGPREFVISDKQCVSVTIAWGYAGGQLLYISIVNIMAGVMSCEGCKLSASVYLSTLSAEECG